MKRFKTVCILFPVYPVILISGVRLSKISVLYSGQFYDPISHQAKFVPLLYSYY